MTATQATNNEVMDAVHSGNPQDLTTQTALPSHALAASTVGTPGATEEEEEEEEEEENNDGDDGSNENSVHQNKRKHVEDWDEILEQELKRVPVRGARFKRMVDKLVSTTKVSRHCSSR
jgi:hypothetical protein